ncbi:hypothetical protein [Bowmanella sp. JS7-9]|uniref:Anti-sigma factor n=1 Tax=Pseudobowmanella zhangzhouensis TaxID=1537679 RepID=A0ABW1XKZ6_9ALTE|nr:hypothetical protein [Bowmanella sp. JS7-9]TBX20445.1 hypothetical protein TK45_15245 [Bowmanella sp. JS7-9]
MQHKETLFALWLDNALDEQQRHEFEQLCIQDEAFAARVAAANYYAADAAEYTQMAMPRWDPKESFVIQATIPWWQGAWLPVSSMAMSVMAVMLVVFNVQLSATDGQLTMRFGSDEQRILAEVNARLDAYQQTQQLALADTVDKLVERQKLNNAELTNYLLTSSRQERREDFAEFIRFVNQQRSDDQVYYARQINALQDKVSDTPRRNGRATDNLEYQE